MRTSLQDQHRTALELLRRLVIFFERFWSVGIIVGTLCCYGLLSRKQRILANCSF